MPRKKATVFYFTVILIITGTSSRAESSKLDKNVESHIKNLCRDTNVRQKIVVPECWRYFRSGARSREVDGIDNVKPELKNDSTEDVIQSTDTNRLNHFSHLTFVKNIDPSTIRSLIYWSYLNAKKCFGHVPASKSASIKTKALRLHSSYAFFIRAYTHVKVEFA
jgi:hypothetical protein